MSRQTLAKFCRLALLLLLTISLWNPALPWWQEKPNLILLYDDSLSMESANDQWLQITQSLIAQSNDYEQLALIRFAANAVVEQPLRQMDSDKIQAMLSRSNIMRILPLDRGGSDIETAFAMALSDSHNTTRPTVILLVSDGWQTDGNASTPLSQAKTAGIQVYAYPPDNRANDSWISQLQLPSQAQSGEHLPITLAINSNYSGQAQLQLLMDNKIINETAIQLQAGKKQMLRFNLSIHQAGNRTITTKLTSPKDGLPENNQRSAIINIAGPLKGLYISNDDSSSPLLRSLQQNGHQVDTIKPVKFSAINSLNQYGLVILDNIASSDLTESNWKALESAVTKHGVGLLVLGGPRTFGRGGYRHSSLEKLLPLTAEAASPQPRAALLFLVDKSGSMANALENVNRFSLAKRAILETAEPLQQDDLVGLIAFDAKPHELLPLETGQEHRRLLASSLNIEASGGTQLKKALALAISRLSAVEAERRLLLLVSDGHMADEDLTELEAAIIESDIDVLALAVGENTDTSQLKTLTALNNGKLLHVSHTASLPRIIRQEVENWRNPAEIRETQPQVTAALPFLSPVVSWPMLSGYMVTKAKPSATVYLQSKQGDPLLAISTAGTGRVAALPAGLGSWASQWHDWGEWGKFTGGLTQWLERNTRNPFLFVTVESEVDGLKYNVDATTTNMDWKYGAHGTITLTIPSGEIITKDLTEVAPGYYQATVENHLPGRYQAHIDIDGETLDHANYFNAAEELTPPNEPPISRWLKDGLITIWNPGMKIETIVNGKIDSRTLLLPIVLVLYLLLLFYERNVSLKQIFAPRAGTEHSK